MKHTPIFILFILISFFLATQSVFAVSLLRSFGGKVTTIIQPGVTCAAQYGIITIAPIGPFPPTPYVIPASNKTVSIGSWILGLYNPVLTPGLCYTDSAPPVPYPTFTIVKFGASRF